MFDRLRGRTPVGMCVCLRLRPFFVFVLLPNEEDDPPVFLQQRSQAITASHWSIAVSFGPMFRRALEAVYSNELTGLLLLSRR